MGKKAFRTTQPRVRPERHEDSAVTTPAEVAIEIDEGEESRPQRFRRRFAAVRLSVDEAARQGKAATLAWEALRDRDAMIAFLNTHDDVLGGRPIDLAVSSDAGLAAVAARLDTHRGNG